MNSRNYLEEIQNLDTDRDFNNLHRRLMKLGEEYGEALQAYLDCTGSGQKNLNLEDFKEEMIDIMIICLDILSYDLPGASVEEIFDKKMNKWQQLRQNQKHLGDSSKTDL